MQEFIFCVDIECYPNCFLPVNNVCEKIIVFKSIIDSNLFIIDGQRPGFNTPFLYCEFD